MEKQIYSCLWFDGNAKEATAYYCSVFKNSKIISENPMVIIFELNNTKFMALNGGPNFKFNEAVSFVITCENQEEIDHYWDSFTQEGEEGKCGWCKDKFGVSWQVVPSILGTLMNETEKAPKTMYAFMQMKKLDIETLINV